MYHPEGKLLSLTRQCRWKGESLSVPCRPTSSLLLERQGLDIAVSCCYDGVTSDRCKAVCFPSTVYLPPSDSNVSHGLPKTRRLMLNAEYCLDEACLCSGLSAIPCPLHLFFLEHLHRHTVLH